jgi:hypothetical protein
VQNDVAIRDLYRESLVKITGMGGVERDERHVGRVDMIIQGAT